MKEKQKRVLITPLNWGLGHATRCIPIINELLAQNLKVFLASDGDALRLLEKEYPELTTFELPAYNIRYGSENMIWNMGIQLPRIINAIRQENAAIKKIVEQNQIDLVLSDNRYGCYHNTTYNVFLTHQLNIKVPWQLLKYLVAQGNRKMLRQFDEIWVPDWPDSENLSGELSHPGNFDNLHYIGLLSRMVHKERPHRYDLAFVLSGPEPQRTYLEQKILSQLNNWTKEKILLVKGRTNEMLHQVEGNLEVVSFLTTHDLNDAMLSSDLIICRPGYSSLMDLVKLKKKALMIPTPGQTEQEYLAAHLRQQGLFYSVTQGEMNLSKDIQMAKTFPGFAHSDFGEEKLRQRVEALKEIISI